MAYGCGLGRRVDEGVTNNYPLSHCWVVANFPKNTKMWGQLGWGHIYQDNDGQVQN